MSYWREVFLGMAEYFTVSKLLVACVAILLYDFCVHEKVSGFMRYTLVALLLVLIPPCAVALLIYQPAIYEYGFLWTMVPVVAVVSYAGVRLLWDILAGLEKSGKGRYLAGALVVCGLLFLSGNREGFPSVTLEEAELRRGYEEVADSLSEGTVLWGPRDLMLWVRRRNGDVKLVYGLDMWDAKAAAYDGDAYEPELTAAYKWMLDVEDYDVYAENIDYIGVEISEEIVSKTHSVFEAVEAKGVNAIVFSTATYKQLLDYLPAGYEKREVGKYTLLLRKG